MESPSPALNHLNLLLVQAFFKTGHYFTAEGDGVISRLAHLLQQHGVQNVQTRAYVLEHRAGTPEGQHFYEDVRLVYRTVLPFLCKWTRIPEDYEAIYQQALNEVQQPGFVGKVGLLTAWGNKPGKKPPVQETPVPR